MSSFSVYLSPRINIRAAWAGEEPKPGPCVRLTFRALPTGQSIFRTALPTPRPGSLKPPFICRRGEGGGTGGEERSAAGTQTQPTPRVSRNHTRPHQPLRAQWARRKKRKRTSCICSKRPSVAPGRALSGPARFQTRGFVGEEGNIRASSAPRPREHPTLTPQLHKARSLPRPQPASKEHPGAER